MMSSPNQSAAKPILGPNTTTSDDDDTSRNPISAVVPVTPKKLMSGAVKYMECLKNHAAAIGGNATDGCGEFMAGGEDGTLEALKCSACNCHRNFHRKIHILHQDPSSVNYMMNKNKIMGGDANGGSSEGGGQATKKRFRTKFSQEQKDKMLEFAERAGWKIQKLDDAEVRRFCQEIGIKRKVLKVWMHNNKYNFANKTSN